MGNEKHRAQDPVSLVLTTCLLKGVQHWRNWTWF